MNVYAYEDRIYTINRMTSFSTVKCGLRKKAKVKAVLEIEPNYCQSVSVSLPFGKSTGGGPSNETICARWYKLLPFVLSSSSCLEHISILKHVPDLRIKSRG